MKAEADIAKELIVAQKEYNQLTKHRPVPRLHKPSVYIPCKQANMLKKLEEIEMDELRQLEEMEEKSASQREINVAVEVKLSTKYDEASGKAVKKICECIVKFKDKRLKDEQLKVEEIMPVRDRGEVKDDEENEEIVLPDLAEIDSGKNVTVPKTSSPQCKCKYLMRKRLRTQSCNCEKCRELDRSLPPFIISGLKQTESGEGTVPVIEGVKDEACDCLTNYQRKLMRYEEYKARHDLVEEMSALSQKFVLGGVCMGPQGKPVFTILGVKPACRCLQMKEEDAPPADPLIKLKEISSSRCTCKPETEEMIEKAVCRCEMCQEMARSRYKHDAIIAGYRAAENETPERIIAGIKTHKIECECLRKYRESIDKYESWKRRNRAVEELKTAEQKFTISGVVSRPNQPPIFIISGVEPQRECPCVQRIREEEAERERLRKMPKKLLGLRYVISGVKETPEGNVYIVSGVKEGKKCKCLQLYDAFMKKHKNCFKIAEMYDEKMKEDLDEHVRDVLGEDKEKDWMADLESTWEPQTENFWEEGDKKLFEEMAEQRLKTEDSKSESEPSNRVCERKCEEPAEEEKPKLDTNLIIKLEYNKNKTEEVCVSCEPKEGKMNVKKEVEMRRIIILDAFPKKRRTQYEILKVC